MTTIGNDNQQPDFIGAWHFLNWLLVLACPRIFHRMTRKPSREHMLKLVDGFLPYARSKRQQLSWRHGSLFEVDRERRQMLAARLRELFDGWSPPDLPPAITETARALLDTEGNDAPPGGWGTLPDPDLPPEDFLLWPEGTPAAIGGFRALPTPQKQRFPAAPPTRDPSAEIRGEPPWPVVERIKGKLHVEPRPALRHVLASSVLGGLLVSAFQLGAGGPGGWVILDKPELHLGDDVILPDMAGFRSERAPVPSDEPSTSIVPDWVCEILSPRRDTSVRVAKILAYAREGVRHAWLLDPFERTLDVLELSSERQWQMIDVFAASMGHTRVRAVPFNAIELDLASLWPERAPR